MKKFVSLMMAMVFALSLCACGDKSDTSTGDTGSATQSKGDSGKSSTDYLTYDDLPRTESFWVWPDEGDEFGFKIDYPDTRFDTCGNGMVSENSLDYSIVVAHAEKPMPGTSLEDAFSELLNGDSGFHSVLRSINSGATYTDMTPEIETVTLPCGKQAIKFTGTQNQDDYGTVTDCPVYGYCVLFEDVPVIVSYVLFDADKVDDGTLDEIKGYVDEMVNTIRAGE